MQKKKLVVTTAVAGLSLTLLFAQNPDVNTQRDALEVLREKRMQLNNPQSVTQSKIFLLQQKEFEAKAEAAKARAEEAKNRAKAAQGKSAEPPTASERANRPAYDQRRLELAAEQAEAEAEVAQAEADAVLAQVDALKSKVEASKAKAEEVRTSPYRRAQSKYYDAQWQEQLEKKTLQEQAAVSKEAVQKTRIASETLKRAKMARDTARKSAMVAKKSGAPVVTPDAAANDQEMARRAHDLEVAQAKAEKEAADLKARAKKAQPVAPAQPKQQEEVRVQNEAIKPSEDALKKQKEETARIAQAKKEAELQAATRKQNEALARQEKELKKQQAKQAKAVKKSAAPVVALRSAPVEASEVENDTQGKAMEALRRKQAELDVKDGFAPRSSTSAAAPITKKSEIKGEPVKVAEIEADNAVQLKALAALRQKQADLDAQEIQTRAASISAQQRTKAEPKAQRSAPEFTRPEIAAAPTTKPKNAVKKASEPNSKAEELELAALSKKSQEPVVERVTAPHTAVDQTEVEAETKKLQDLRQRQADLRAQQIKIKTDLQDASRTTSETKGKADDSLELIVDNQASRPTGTWMNGKTRGFYGGDYIWKGKGTGANYVKFVPVIPIAGEYEVYEWHVGGTNRASDAPYIISYNGGTQTILVNQQINGSKWNLLGKFNFTQGSSGEIRITDGISMAGQMVMADAVRFVAAGSGPVNSAVVDSSASKQVEDLRKQQSDLDAELAKLKQEIIAADSRLTELKAANEKAQLHAAEQEAVQKATQPAKPSTRVALKPDVKKTSAKNTAQALTPEKTAVLTPKEKKLAELLVRYKNDEVTPHEYHQMRAKIIAEP
jgi:hypothetical protein